MAFCRTVLGILQTRTELFAVELALERRRLVHIAVYAGLALMLLAVGLQVLAFGAVAWFWDTAYRWTALACVAGTCAACAAWCVRLATRRLRAHPRPFEASLAALATDLGGS